MITNVLEYLELSAARLPEKVVFADNTKSITYAEVLDKAQRIGSYLIHNYGTRNKPIAVLIGRNVESLVMFLGVTYSGNFYVPIDPDLPENRLNTMFNTMVPVAVIGDLQQIALDTVQGMEVIDYHKMTDGNKDEEAIANVRASAIDTDPLYAIFTSGSTGVPKMVLAAHKCVIDLAEVFGKTFGIREEDIFGNQAPFDYDASVKDIYQTLKNGATLHIIPKQFFAFPVKLIEYVNERKVTTAFWTTSVLCIMANLRALRKSKPLYIKRILFSGEVMPIKVLNYWKENLPDVTYVNLYGPTEITCNCTYYIVDRDYEVGEVLPIGQAFRNTDILVLNDQNVPVQQGELGELCVRGRSLALGYYNNPEKTAEAFCQNPLNTNYPELIYRTGDLVKYDENGQLIYCARKDFQIKHMGHRIELGEIEVAVDALDFIARSCCMYDLQKEKIILVYQATEECSQRINDCLSEKLPKYMIPTQMHWKAEMPISKTGKIDRALLKKEYITE